MIGGVHIVISSKNPEADSAFLRDVLAFRFVDAGNGRLIFALPRAEAGIHAAETSGRHEMYLQCDNVAAEVAALRAKGVQCADVVDTGWGLLTKFALPGGGEIQLYQPKHAQP